MSAKKKTVALSEAGRSLGRLLEQAAAGCNIIVTKRGQPVGQLLPAPLTKKFDPAVYRKVLKELSSRPPRRILRKGETWKDFTHGR